MQMSPDLVFCPCLQSLVGLHMQMTPYPRELTLQHGSMPMASHLHANAPVNIHDPENTEPPLTVPRLIYIFMSRFACAYHTDSRSALGLAVNNLHIHEVVCVCRAVETSLRCVNIHRRICMPSHNFAWCHLHMN